MRQIKMPLTVFALSVICAIALLSIAISVNGAHINIFPGTDTGSTDGGGLAIVLGFIVGIINGFPIGVCSVLYLEIRSVVLNEWKVSIFEIFIYAIIIGFLESLFLSGQIVNQYESYNELLSDNWKGLVGVFVIGFLIAFFPIIFSKRIFYV